MGKKIEDGGAAFPFLSEWSDDKIHANQDGMTLRDYFAGKTMQKIISPEYLHKTNEQEAIAELAYKMADAMIVARSENVE